MREIKFELSHKNAQLLQKLSRFISSVHSFFFPFSWERLFTNLLEQRTKDIPYMRYDKAKLPEFYLQEENLEKIIAEMGKNTLEIHKSRSIAIPNAL